MSIKWTIHNKFTPRDHHLAEVTGVVDFLDISKDTKVLDIGGGYGTYSKAFNNNGFKVTLLDSYDYNFKELNDAGIKTIISDFCTFQDGDYDLLFMAHVYHDLVHSCKENVLLNIQRISPKYIVDLDFSKEGFKFGPPKWLRLDKEEVEDDMRTIGFSLKKEKLIPDQYLLLFEKD